MLVKLNGYNTRCSECQNMLTTVRTIKSYLKFLLILLECCDEFSSLGTRQNLNDFNRIIISDLLNANNRSYVLSSIIYFQNRHYTAHVNNINHMSLFEELELKWYFHDGMKNSGKLIPLDPQLKYDIKRSLQIPYVILYKFEG